MPTNRTPISRPRRPTAPDETVELFRKLEATPMRQRSTGEFRAQDKALHKMLGLGYERTCAAVSVLDCNEPQPDWYPAQIVLTRR
jgi:hypothetical protein